MEKNAPNRPDFIEWKEWNDACLVSAPVKILLVYPRFPPTFWNQYFSFRDIIKGPKAALAPLSPVTIASFFPKNWQVRFVDENVEKVGDRDLRWADAVMASCTMDQIDAYEAIERRAHDLNKPVAVGGLDPSMRPHFYEGADYIHIGLIGDATIGLIADLSTGLGRPPGQKIFKVNRRLSLDAYPIPRYELLKMKDYSAMCLICGLGCPFSCEFCEIVRFYGRVPDIKTPERVTAELEILYKLGWRGNIHFADDNFIGDLPKRRELIGAIAGWQKKHDYPFQFTIEVSIDLAEHEDLLGLLREARVFLGVIGIETPNAGTLQAIGKEQNMRKPLAESVMTLHRYGIQVSGTFVIGFDTDASDAGDDICEFVEKTAICIPQLTTLLALQGTPLYDRLYAEGRIISRSKKWEILDSNIVFAKGQKEVFRQYAEAWKRIYEPKTFFRRLQRNFGVTGGGNARYSRAISLTSKIFTFPNMLWRMGICAEYRMEFWKFFIWAVCHGAFDFFVFYAILAYHYINFRSEVLRDPPRPVLKEVLSRDGPTKDYARLKNGPVIYSH